MWRMGSGLADLASSACAHILHRTWCHAQGRHHGHARFDVNSRCKPPASSLLGSHDSNLREILCSYRFRALCICYNGYNTTGPLFVTVGTSGQRVRARPLTLAAHSTLAARHQVPGHLWPFRRATWQIECSKLLKQNTRNGRQTILTSCWCCGCCRCCPGQGRTMRHS